jgi:predicted protein tyrosine phosphatase/GGDEF domain-containing protein
MDHIVNNLWLGDQRDADELIRKNPEGITAILNVRGPDAYKPAGRDQSAEHPGKAYKWIAAPDTGVVSPKNVKQALIWLREQTDKGERILIHCKYGISRSPAFLAAFMVESGISANLEEATAAIAMRRSVLPATQIVESVKPVVLVSELTGLPNRRAFDDGKASSFVAIVDISRMRTFADFYGQMPSNGLVRRLAQLLSGAGLDAYHDREDRFLCKGEKQLDLDAKVSLVRRNFRAPFQVYANGRFQIIEEADFSFGIGTTLEEAEAALGKAKKSLAKNDPPEWLRKIVGEGGLGRGW